MVFAKENFSSQIGRQRKSSGACQTRHPAALSRCPFANEKVPVGPVVLRGGLRQGCQRKSGKTRQTMNRKMICLFFIGIKSWPLCLCVLCGSELYCLHVDLQRYLRHRQRNVRNSAGDVRSHHCGGLSEQETAQSRARFSRSVSADCMSCSATKMAWKSAWPVFCAAASPSNCIYIEAAENTEENRIAEPNVTPRSTTLTITAASSADIALRPAPQTPSRTATASSWRRSMPATWSIARKLCSSRSLPMPASRWSPRIR